MGVFQDAADKQHWKQKELKLSTTDTLGKEKVAIVLILYPLQQQRPLLRGAHK